MAAENNDQVKCATAFLRVCEALETGEPVSEDDYYLYSHTMIEKYLEHRYFGCYQKVAFPVFKDGESSLYHDVKVPVKIVCDIHECDPDDTAKCNGYRYNCGTHPVDTFYIFQPDDSKDIWYCNDTLDEADGHVTFFKVKQGTQTIQIGSKIF